MHVLLLVYVYIHGLFLVSAVYVYIHGLFTVLSVCVYIHELFLVSSVYIYMYMCSFLMGFYDVGLKGGGGELFDL